MGSIMKVVPVAEFDLDWHESAIRSSGERRFEDDEGNVFPSDKEHAADVAAILEVKRGLDALTGSQRRASRWPTRAELRAVLERVAKHVGGELWFGPNTGPWRQGSVSVYAADDPDLITSDITVSLSGSRDREYSCSADAAMLRAFAREVANVAGHQVTFLAEDYSPADFTALVPPAMSHQTPKPKPRRRSARTRPRTASAKPARRRPRQRD
jgi:hypothetical protein